MGHSGRKYGYYHCPRKNCRYSIRHELAADVLTGFLRDESVPSGVLSLFTEVVENARRQRHDASNRLRNQSQLKLDQLAEKREKLSEALIYRNAIDKATYDAQIVKLDEAERLAREEINDLTRSVPNIAEAVARGQQLLGDLPALWEHLDPAQRAAFLQVMYPAGVYFEREQIRTAQKPWYHLDLAVSSDVLRAEVPRAGLEPACLSAVDFKSTASDQFRHRGLTRIEQ